MKNLTFGGLMEELRNVGENQGKIRMFGSVSFKYLLSFEPSFVEKHRELNEEVCF